jgi:rhodanese-related sulfurtransferase
MTTLHSSKAWILVAALGLPLAALPACDRSASPAQAAKEPGPAELKQLVDKGAALIDVRTPAEFAGGHVRGAENIPVDELEAKLPEVAELTGDKKDGDVVVYCRSGHRAGIAKDILTKAGYTKVHNLGGLSDWPDAKDIVQP